MMTRWNQLNMVFFNQTFLDNSDYLSPKQRFVTFVFFFQQRVKFFQVGSLIVIDCFRSDIHMYHHNMLCLVVFQFPGLLDSCSQSVELFYTNEMNVTLVTTFTSRTLIVELEQGRKYHLVINLQLLINRLFTVWNSKFITKRGRPTCVLVDQGNTSLSSMPTKWIV